MTQYNNNKSRPSSSSREPRAYNSKPSSRSYGSDSRPNRASKPFNKSSSPSGNTRKSFGSNRAGEFERNRRPSSDKEYSPESRNSGKRYEPKKDFRSDDRPRSSFGENKRFSDNRGSGARKEYNQDRQGSQDSSYERPKKDFRDSTRTSESGRGERSFERAGKRPDGRSKNFGTNPSRGGYSAGRSGRSDRSDRSSGSGGRSARFQKTMDVDYNILVKKAAPQAIADYTPSKSFSEHGLHHDIIRSLDLKGYTQPTAIQDQAIPHILDKKDLIGIANTGTGKTAAFLLPLIHQVLDEPDKKILILAPTRELVTQISSELHSFTKGSKISSTVIMGGVGQERQVTDLKKGKNFIISTTGRGLDLINQKKLPIREIETIVLDEMDQMLDMGFIKDIQKILALAVNKKHLLFFSATINRDVDKIAREILNEPILVSVVRGQTADNVNQDVVEIGSGDNKFEKLCEILSRPEVEKAIIFENTKHGSARLEKDLLARGFKTLAIHGNKNQNQRTRALDAFKSGKINILIATNVAARGLDIPLVSHVINYSLPQSKDDYIHRIGRTGRAGEIGQAYTFVPK